MEMESKQPSDQQCPEDSTVESLIEYERIVRQEFSSEEDAQEFFNSYAKQKGFSIRKMKPRRISRAGPVYFRTFVCSKAGFRKEFFLKVNERKRKSRAVTRCGCPVRFSVKLHSKTGRWYIDDFYDVHNHEMALP